MEFNVCVVGCGAMGQKHVEEWSRRPDSAVVAVCDILPERARAFAEKTGAQAFEQYQKAILCDGVNVVSVCTPVCHHFEIAAFAAENGRHVITEKPIALTLDQADGMIEAARKNDVRLVVSYQMRDSPRSRHYREIIRRGDFGGPVFARFVDVREVRPKLAMHGKWMNGGPLIDMAGHWFDLMRFWTGEEPIAVSAAGHVFGRGKKRLKTVEDFAIDAAEVQVRYGGGHVLSAFANWGMPEGFRGISEESLCGPELALQLSQGKIIAHYAHRQEIWQDFQAEFQGPGARIHDLVEAIRERRNPVVDGAAGRAALRVCLAALESIETGKTVYL